MFDPLPPTSGNTRVTALNSSFTGAALPRCVAKQQYTTRFWCFSLIGDPNGNNRTRSTLSRRSPDTFDTKIITSIFLFVHKNFAFYSRRFLFYFIIFFFTTVIFSGHYRTRVLPGFSGVLSIHSNVRTRRSSSSLSYGGTRIRVRNRNELVCRPCPGGFGRESKEKNNTAFRRRLPTTRFSKKHDRGTLGRLDENSQGTTLESPLRLRNVLRWLRPIYSF